MTTKFLTIKFAKFPYFIVMEFPRKNSVFGRFSVNFPPPQPLQKANFINIVVSASLIESHQSRYSVQLRLLYDPLGVHPI